VLAACRWLVNRSNCRALHLPKPPDATPMPRPYAALACCAALALLLPAIAAADFVHVNGFEPAVALYANSQPHTIVVVDGSIADAAHERSIPVRVRYPREPAEAGLPLPIVVWVHGGDADPNGRLGSQQWSETFVRAGYIAVHFSVMPRNAAQREALWASFGLDASQAGSCGFNPVFVDRPRDTIAVLDALPSLGVQIPALANAVDLSRVAVAGHSYGAYTTRAVAGARLDLCPTGIGAPAGWPYRDTTFRDPRPLAFVALSPQGPGRFAFFEQSFGVLDRPDFMATGAADITPGESPADRLRSFELIAPRSKYLLYIDSPRASHASFNLADPLSDDFDPWLQSHVLAFLDAFLRGRAQALEALHSGALDGVSNGEADVQWK
jgi:predicted dienelactone hydrolase